MILTRLLRQWQVPLSFYTGPSGTLILAYAFLVEHIYLPSVVLQDAQKLQIYRSPGFYSIDRRL